MGDLSHLTAGAVEGLEQHGVELEVEALEGAAHASDTTSDDDHVALVLAGHRTSGAWLRSDHAPYAWRHLTTPSTLADDQRRAEVARAHKLVAYRTIYDTALRVGLELEYDQSPRFSLARTLIRASARAALEEALRIFEDLGAPIWAQK